jgi:hypothetical protein
MIVIGHSEYPNSYSWQDFFFGRRLIRYQASTPSFLADILMLPLSNMLAYRAMIPVVGSKHCKIAMYTLPCTI